MGGGRAQKVPEYRWDQYLREYLFVKWSWKNMNNLNYNKNCCNIYFENWNWKYFMHIESTHTKKSNCPRNESLLAGLQCTVRVVSPQHTVYFYRYKVAKPRSGIERVYYSRHKTTTRNDNALLSFVDELTISVYVCLRGAHKETTSNVSLLKTK